MQLRRFLIVAIALLLQVVPSWSASETVNSSGLLRGGSGLLRGGDDRPEGMSSELGAPLQGQPSAPPILEPPIPPTPTTIQQALRYISQLYPGSAANPGAVIEMVPEVIGYLDKKNREFYYEAVKDFETNIDVVRKSRQEAMVAEAQRRCENSLRMVDVAVARAAAARGPADQADADRLLKLAIDQKKSDCDM
jgi:hypothetical protein